jgi:hypothetical protein
LKNMLPFPHHSFGKCLELKVVYWSQLKM